MDIIDDLRLLGLQNRACYTLVGRKGRRHEALLGRALDAIEPEIRLILVQEKNRGSFRRHGFHDGVQNSLQEFMGVQALGDHGANRQVGIEVPGLSQKLPVQGVQA